MIVSPPSASASARRNDAVPLSFGVVTVIVFACTKIAGPKYRVKQIKTRSLRNRNVEVVSVSRVESVEEASFYCQRVKGVEIFCAFTAEFARSREIAT